MPRKGKMYNQKVYAKEGHEHVSGIVHTVANRQVFLQERQVNDSVPYTEEVVTGQLR